MKKFFSPSNIQAILLILLSITETVLLILFKPLPVWSVLLILLYMLLCIAEIRFAYQFVLWGNIWHSLWRRKNVREMDDEPSDFAVGGTKAVGYILLLLSQIILFV